MWFGVKSTVLCKTNDSFVQMWATRDLRICCDMHDCVCEALAQSWENMTLPVFSIYQKKNKNKKNRLTHKGQLPLCAGLIHSSKFQQICPFASSDIPLLAGTPLTNPPLTTTNLLHKHSEPITINPTPGNTPQPQTCTKTSFSITGESYCPTNLSFLSHKSSRPLNHYVLELGLFHNWRHHPQVTTTVGTGALVWEGEIFVVGIAGYVFLDWWSLLK